MRVGIWKAPSLHMGFHNSPLVHINCLHEASPWLNSWIRWLRCYYIAATMESN